LFYSSYLPPHYLNGYAAPPAVPQAAAAAAKLLTHGLANIRCFNNWTVGLGRMVKV